MSEVTITIKDVVDGDNEGVMFDYDIKGGDEDSFSIWIAGEMALRAAEILEQFTTENKVH